MIVNLIDENISHADSYDETLERGRIPEKISYVKMLSEYDGITIFTGRMTQFVGRVNTKKNVAWIMEPRAFEPQSYQILEQIGSSFDLILTHDQKLLDMYPEKAAYMPADGIFVDTPAIHDKHAKSRDCSHIFSDKRILEGHRLRHDIAHHIRKAGYDVDFYGRGCNPIDRKAEALLPYRFSISIENNRAPNYHTEKILDCFACRTVPVYWGDPTVFEHFDQKGIIVFESAMDLMQIIPKLNEDLYLSMLDPIEANHAKSLDYYSIDNIVADILSRRFGVE